HTRSKRDWSSDVCSSDLCSHGAAGAVAARPDVDPSDRAVAWGFLPTAAPADVILPTRLLAAASAPDTRGPPTIRPRENRGMDERSEERPVGKKLTVDVRD